MRTTTTTPHPPHSAPVHFLSAGHNFLAEHNRCPLAGRRADEFSPETRGGSDPARDDPHIENDKRNLRPVFSRSVLATHLQTDKTKLICGATAALPI